MLALPCTYAKEQHLFSKTNIKYITFREGLSKTAATSSVLACKTHGYFNKIPFHNYSLRKPLLGQFIVTPLWAEPLVKIQGSVACFNEEQKLMMEPGIWCNLVYLQRTCKNLVSLHTVGIRQQGSLFAHSCKLFSQKLSIGFSQGHAPSICSGCDLGFLILL